MCGTTHYKTTSSNDACLPCEANVANCGDSSPGSCLSGYWRDSISDLCVEVCPPGKYESDGDCIHCEVGKFSPYPGAVTCIQCVAGTASSNIGSSASTCIGCPAGTYSEIGADICIPCANGKYSTPYAASCKGCEAGKYGATGQPMCHFCPAGTYSTAGASTCTACDNGDFSGPGASECDSCSN